MVKYFSARLEMDAYPLTLSAPPHSFPLIDLVCAISRQTASVTDTQTNPELCTPQKDMASNSGNDNKWDILRPDLDTERELNLRKWCSVSSIFFLRCDTHTHEALEHTHTHTPTERGFQGWTDKMIMLLCVCTRKNCRGMEPATPLDGPLLKGSEHTHAHWED